MDQSSSLLPNSMTSSSAVNALRSATGKTLENPCLKAFTCTCAPVPMIASSTSSMYSCTFSEVTGILRPPGCRDHQQAVQEDSLGKATYPQLNVIARNREVQGQILDVHFLNRGNLARKLFVVSVSIHAKARQVGQTLSVGTSVESEAIFCSCVRELASSRSTSYEITVSSYKTQGSPKSP